jgi:hypothetical protein
VSRINLSLCMIKDYDIKVYNMFYSPGVVFSLLSCQTHPFFLHPFPDDNSMTKSFPCKGIDLAESDSSWWTGQTLILYSMFCSFWSSWPCKGLLIERFNKIGVLNLYDFSTQTHVSLISQNGGVTSANNLMDYYQKCFY